MDSASALMVLILSVLLTAGVITASGTLPALWAPAPRPVVESVLVVGGDVIVDVRNPSETTLRGCRVYAGDRLLTGPPEILPGKIATYTGPAVSRYVNAVCGESRDVKLAYQVGDDSQTQQGGSGGGSGNGMQLRHLQCEVRSVGNRRVVRMHVNIEAAVNQGAKPYNFTINFGDGAVETSITQSSAYTTIHLYDGEGPYTATLLVIDALGRGVTAQLTIPSGCRNT